MLYVADDEDVRKASSGGADFEAWAASCKAKKSWEMGRGFPLEQNRGLFLYPGDAQFSHTPTVLDDWASWPTNKLPPR